jgi:Zn-dependent M28 family amino/carboxypeptidase
MFIRMPGTSYAGPLAALTPDEVETRERLRGHIRHLSVDIGERHVRRPRSLAAAADYIADAFSSWGYEVERQVFQVGPTECRNLAAARTGASRPESILVVGGHYDTVPGSPGANDNGTGVAATLELARLFAGKRVERTVRFLAFVNEEPPYFQTDLMGSLVYARRCRARGERIDGMFSLETLGCYSDAPGSQQYPFPFSLCYPSTGDFIAFVGNAASGDLVRRAVGAFRELVPFPSQGGALPGFIEGVGWSDHWSFWQADYPALMVTDTAPFRYPHYHEASDTPDKIDHDRLARVAAGLAAVIERFANRPDGDR